MGKSTTLWPWAVQGEANCEIRASGPHGGGESGYESFSPRLRDYRLVIAENLPP